MTFFLLCVIYTVIASSQCQEFSELNATLKHGMANFCVGVDNSTLTALYNEYSWTAPMAIPNSLNWTYNDDVDSFANDVSYFGQVCIQHKYLLYGVPSYQYYSNSQPQYNRLFIFDLQQNEYKPSCNLKIPTKASCVVIAGDELYIIGGTNMNWISNTVQSYNIKKKRFDILLESTLNTPRMLHGCSINADTQNSNEAGYIYIFGGFGGKYYDYNLLRTIEKYDIQNDKWIQLNHVRLSIARKSHTCSYVEPYIYCVGGTVKNEHATSSVEIFDVLNEKMVNDNTLHLNIARRYHSAIVYKNYFLILGGYDENWKKLNSTEALIFDEPTFTPTSNPTMNDNQATDESNIGLMVTILCLSMSALIAIFYLCYHRKHKILKHALLEMEHEEKVYEEYIPYFEKQKWEFCLVHSLNALFQEKKFEPKDLNDVCQILAPNKLINPHKSILQTGNYDANVLMFSLENHNVSVQWFDSRKCEQDLDLFNEEFLCPKGKEYKEFVGFVVNNKHKKMYVFNRRHWLTIKRINNIWYNLDSRMEKPIKYETILEIKALQNWLVNACKNNDAQLMICRTKK